ncbi:hypothetical protein C1646_812279 [Rhizophagus diaphanus]|nr:hypothetical protein C1646_812279 [Rhizophagus diaphanus] [Rhizophagus sp. MUCL 43196]
MNYFTILSIFILLSLINISSALRLGRRNGGCECSFAIADFKSGSARGIVTFSQNELGHTEVAGIFSKGLNDDNASYGFRIVDECRNVLFDLTDGLDIKPDGDGGSKSFRHKFTEFDVDCTSNGILTKKIHNSKRNNDSNCHNNKLRKRLPNGGELTINGEGSDYAGLTK